MIETDRRNKIMQAVSADLPAEEICETDEERLLYKRMMNQKNGWMRRAGMGFEMINDVG